MKNYTISSNNTSDNLKNNTIKIQSTIVYSSTIFYLDLNQNGILDQLDTKYSYTDFNGNTIATELAVSYKPNYQIGIFITTDGLKYCLEFYEEWSEISVVDKNNNSYSEFMLVKIRINGKEKYILYAQTKTGIPVIIG